MVALVFPELASEPALGSVKAYAAFISALAIFGKYFFFCSSLP